MATEELEEPSTTSKEAAKIIVPTVKEGKLETKRIILLIIGYSSLVFAILSLFFPLWINYTPVPPNFVSFWQITPLGISLYHWEILWYYQIFMEYVIPSIFFLIMLIILLFVIIKRVWKIIMHDWKQLSSGTPFFTISILILIMIVVLSFFVPEFDLSGNPGYFTVLYGETWGLSFGWYSLLLAGILGIIYQKFNERFEKSKKEDLNNF